MTRRSRTSALAVLRQPAATLAAVALVLLAACSSSPTSSSSSSTTSTLAPGTVTTTTTPEADTVVFTTTDGNIDAYLPSPPYTRQRVVAAGTGPAGTTPHGQICFDTDGSRRFVVAETHTPPSGPATAGWGMYQLTGNDIGSYQVRRITGWDSRSTPSADAPSTYGCAFLSNGQLLTTDVGNRLSGDGTGQLIQYFPPFDSPEPASCVLATGVATPLGLTVGEDGIVYLASTRAPTAGVWRYAGTFPADAASCAPAVVAPPASPGTTVGPSAAVLTATLVIAAGDHALSTPSAVSVVPSGGALVVTSPPDGVIVAYKTDGSFIGSLLEPPTGTTLGDTPFPDGSPFGVVVSPDGAVIYADPGLVRDAQGALVPGERTGTLRTIQTGNNAALTPDTVDDRLQAPDGVGLYLPSGGGGAASKA